MRRAGLSPRVLVQLLGPVGQDEAAGDATERTRGRGDHGEARLREKDEAVEVVQGAIRLGEDAKRSRDARGGRRSRR